VDNFTPWDAVTVQSGSIAWTAGTRIQSRRSISRGRTGGLVRIPINETNDQDR
jgi:hypothetical protein